MTIGAFARRPSRRLVAFAFLTLAGPALAQYQQTNLVSDGSIPAAHTDANLVNPWGIAFNPGGPVWIANNHSGTSTLYDGLGNPYPTATPLVVNIPSPSGPTGGAATGMVYSGGSDFMITNGAVSGPARFIYATEDGTIAGWSSSVPPPAPSTQAFIAVNHSTANSIYKGLAIGSNAAGNAIFATDFHNSRVEAFNGTFAPATLTGNFQDPTLPAGYAPFGIQMLNNKLYVSYALQDADGEDDVPGAGHGFINVFDTSGNLLNRLVSGGALNSPWGMALAPSNFGAFSNDLLVGNFGDGRIHAFDPISGALLGTLSDASNQPLQIDGLWGLAFGNGLLSQPTNSLFFTAGPNGEANGLYGDISAVPEPVTGVMLLALAGLALRASRNERR